MTLDQKYMTMILIEAIIIIILILIRFIRDKKYKKPVDKVINSIANIITDSNKSNDIINNLIDINKKINQNEKFIKFEIENDSNESVFYNIYLKFNQEEEYIKVYSSTSLSKSYNFYRALYNRSSKEVYRLFNDIESYSMIIYHDQIYKLEFFRKEDLSIIASLIPNNKKYGDTSQDKIRLFLDDDIDFINKDELLIRADQIFLNGYLLYDDTEFDKLIKTIYNNKEEVYADPKKLIKAFMNKYSIKTYNSKSLYISDMDQFLNSEEKGVED